MNRFVYIVLLFLGTCSFDSLKSQDTSLIIRNTAFDEKVLWLLDEVTLERLDKIKNVKLHTSFFAFQGDLDYEMGSVKSADSEKARGYIYRKLRLENFVEVDTGDFVLLINPAFNFELGGDSKDSTGERLYFNTRGISVHGKIGKNVTFYSRFYENQAFLPGYLDDFVADYGVIPGQGRVKKFKETGYDYAMASGVVSVSPNKRLNIQLGNGKHHLGDGYRSLSLSSNAFNYPFVKITSWFGPFQYTNLFMGLQNLNIILPTSISTEPRFQRKLGSLHHLDWIVNKKLTIGVFEQMIWASSDSKGKLEMNSDAVSFINPVPFIRPLQYGLSDENNVLVGFNGKLRWPKKTEFYSQVVLDDMKAKKSGYQLGVKTRIIRNFILRAEYNKVLPYTYSHSDSTRNFGHYNQSLAHPLGAGFAEITTSISYYFKDFFLILKMNDVKYDLYGSPNIFKSDTATMAGAPGPPLSISYLNFQLGYLINQVSGMQLALGMIDRSENWVTGVEGMRYFYLSFSTNIRRQLYDF